MTALPLRVALAAVAAGLVLLAAAPASAQDGRLLYVREGALWEQEVRGGAAREVARLPDGVEVKGLEASSDGRAVALDLGAGSAWVVDGKLTVSRCTGRARVSPSGARVVCPAAGGILVEALAGGGGAPIRIPGTLREVGFLDDKGSELFALGDDGVVALRPEQPAVRRRLAPKGARSHLLVAPSAARAVAVFGEKEASRIFTFALDGRGTPRQLGGPGVPLFWSADSVWVLVEEGLLAVEDLEEEDEGELSAAPDERWLLAARRKSRKKKKPPPARKPPEVRICAVRAVGGEWKCWNDYTGLGFSPDSSWVLMRRDATLYAAPVAGVRAATPVKLIDRVPGPAVWVRR